jgi:two-component system, OmpR family, KDP operon response regulator KdpE
MENHKINILVVDDETEIRRFLRVSLRANQFEVSEAENGLSALISIRKNKPDLMILDLGLPDIDGVEVTQRARLISQLPIIILSVRDRETDKIQALDAGADDYLTKPFGVGELLARIRVVMRHSANDGNEPIYSVEGLKMDVARHQVVLNGKEIDLTPNEFEILRILMQKAGRVITHRLLIHEVWGTISENDDRMLRVNISNLRKKIEADPNQPHYLLTELGVGYRLKE